MHGYDLAQKGVNIQTENNISYLKHLWLLQQYLIQF